MPFCYKTTKKLCDCVSEVEIVFLLKLFREEVYVTHTQRKSWCSYHVVTIGNIPHQMFLNFSWIFEKTGKLHC